MQDPKAPQHKILQILPLFLQILPFSEVIKRDFLLFWRRKRSNVCTARKPHCDRCDLSNLCPKLIEGSNLG